MDSVTVLQIAVGTLAILVTILNLIYAFTPSIYAKFETKKMSMEAVSFEPKNPFGPAILMPGVYYLDLVISNVGSGVGKDINWTLTKEKIKMEPTAASGVLPYLGRSNETSVQGYIECATTELEEEEIRYKVKIEYKRLFGFGNLSIFLLYDGAGKLISYKKK